MQRTNKSWYVVRLFISHFIVRTFITVGIYKNTKLCLPSMVCAREIDWKKIKDSNYLFNQCVVFSLFMFIKVGACIVNADNKIVSIGYNGMPAGCNDGHFSWERGEGVKLLDSKHTYGNYNVICTPTCGG